MKDNYKLIAITIVLVLLGLVFGFVSWKNSEIDLFDKCTFEGSEFSPGEEVVGYEANSNCICVSGGIIECTPLLTESVQLDTYKEPEDTWKNQGLKFEYTYLSGILEDNGSVVFNPTFTDVSIIGGDLVVVLELMQICPEANVLSEQEAFYENIGDEIRLYNLVEEDSGIDCIVELKYIFENFEDMGLDDFSIVFVDEGITEIQASICIYDEKVYSEGDVFKGADQSICFCESGEVICEEELSD